MGSPRNTSKRHEGLGLEPPAAEDARTPVSRLRDHITGLFFDSSRQRVILGCVVAVLLIVVAVFALSMSIVEALIVALLFTAVSLVWTFFLRGQADEYMGASTPHQVESDTDVGDGGVTLDKVARSARAGDHNLKTPLWHALVQAVPDATVVLANNGRVLRYNRSARELFPGIRLGQPISRVTRNPELIDAVDQCIRLGGAPIVVEIVERLPVERRISATVSKLSHGDNASAAPDMLIFFRDHSEQDRLEQMRSDFVANASHELRTPLASLRGYIDTLQGPARNDADAQDRFLGIMAKQAERMTRLIDDLLSLSRVEMRAHLPPSDRVDVNEIAHEVLQSLKLLAESSEISIKLKSSNQPAFIRGDREEIAQVLQNLVHNAVKYGRPGGNINIVIDVSFDPKGEPKTITVAVEDDGVGIAAQHLPRLTERFYRANVASSREKGGTGLGLAIVKHIVARHRGDLKIESELERGSKFSVSFDAIKNRRKSE